MECMTISELRIDLRETLERVSWEGKHVLIRKHGKDVGVLIPPETYFRWEKEYKSLSHPDKEQS